MPDETAKPGDGATGNPPPPDYTSGVAAFDPLAPTVIFGKHLMPGISPEKAGDSIGRYKLLAELGVGGFGIVWRAEQHVPIHREVALKVIKPGMDSREIIARFEAERQALALMDHPNIAGVLDAGATDNGRPYFVMELVKGVPITDYCDEHKLTIRERLELFIPVCQAVQHAHQKAILHRDLKPSNILIAEIDGKAVPKVIDFGIAKALGTSAEAALQATLARTVEGMVVGTPQYMSPEQAGSGPDMDTRSDIYTLGVILYELLVGNTPLPREQLKKAAFDEVFRLIREAEPVRPSSCVVPISDIVRETSIARGTEPGKLTRALRGDLDWITLKALEKDRERRYDSAAAFAQDIERHLKNEPVEAGPPSAFYRLRKMVQRNRLAFAAAAAIVVLLVAGIAVSTWQAVRASNAESLARQRLADVQNAQGRTKQALDDAQASERKATLNAELATKNEHAAKASATAAAASEQKALQNAELAVKSEQATKAANAENLSHLHDASMADYAVAVERIENEGRWDEGVAHLARALHWEPSNESAYNLLYNTIALFAPMHTNIPFQILRHNGVVQDASFSPDGRLIVTASDDKSARIWDLASGQPLGKPMLHDGEVHSAQFSPDGTRVITWSRPEKQVADAVPYEDDDLRHDWGAPPYLTRPYPAGTAIVWEVFSGKQLGKAVPSRDVPIFSPDGTKIITQIGKKGMRLWDGSNCTPLGEPMRQENDLDSMSFSPDGSRIVTVASSDKGARSDARIWDVATGKQLGKPMRCGAMVLCAIFSPDSKRLATGNGDKTARLWDVKTGEQIGKPMLHENPVRRVSFSPDGTRIIAATDIYHPRLGEIGDAEIRVWDASNGSLIWKNAQSRRSSEVAFSPDGRCVVSSEGGVQDALTGTSLGGGMHEGIRTVRFNPNGRWIVTAHNGGTACVWEIATGKPIGETLIHDRTYWPVPIEFSRDGTRLITTWCNSTEDKPTTWREWDSYTGKFLREALDAESLRQGAVKPANVRPDKKWMFDYQWYSLLPHWDNRAAIDGEAIVSPDGTRVIEPRNHFITALEVNSVRHLPAITPKWVIEWGNAVAGKKFNENGAIWGMTGKERYTVLHTRHNFDDPWSQLARWLVTDPAKRTTHPDSTHTCREIAERERDFGDRESLQVALRYDPTVPLARLLLAKFEENSQRAAFLRDYDLQRLPDDPALWSRAVEALHEQKDEMRARRAQATLTKLNSSGAAAAGSKHEKPNIPLPKDVEPPKAPDAELFGKDSPVQEGERYPQTRQRLFTEDDIAKIVDFDVHYAINEMYARHGGVFPDEATQKQFDKLPWDHPREGMDFDGIEAEFFSNIEKQNLKLLARIRDEKKGKK